MTLGLPEHLARESLSRALARAGQCAAAVCLAAALVLTIASAVAASAPTGEGPDRQRAALAATVLLSVQALLLYLVARYETVTLTVMALVGGTAAVFGLTVLLLASGDVDSAADNALVALSRAALVLVGGAGIGSGIAITWAVLGWGLGEAAAFLGATVIGAPWAPSLPALAVLTIVIIARTFDAAARRAVDRRETALHRASQQTRELTIRHDYELRAIARLHDTALSHLISIATAGSGAVDERLRSAIRSDLSLIVGRDWAGDHTEAHGDGLPPRTGAAVPSAASPSSRTPADGAAAVGPGPAFRASPPPLAEALGIARDAGVAVHVAGSPAALETLAPARRDALEAAVAQCLINVVRHAGVDEAEVAVDPGDGEVTVVVIDGGAGFDPDAVPDDRIGLRTSIRGRIEQEGGTARIWSRPGVGTTVVLTVPDGAR
ncbi:sensor histidine kinase [Agromyces sp. NPDC056523]|uniref:sensor histidine kinase n=1 Tax=Agromyces sp. NPDC056523 TaxID=3345850 RepID=UPI00366BC77C